MNIVVTILVVLLIVAGTLIVTLLVAAGFVGVGALLARFTELTLFQATIVVVPVGLGLLYVVKWVLEIAPLSTEDDDWDDWDEDLDFEDLPPETRRILLRSFAASLGELDDEEDVVQLKPVRRRRRR